MFLIRYKSANILSWSVGCLFPFLMFSFKAPQFLILMKSDLFLFFLFVLLVSYLWTPWLIQGHEDLLLCFLLVVVLALTLGFKSLWINTCGSCEEGVHFVPLHVVLYLFQDHFLKRLLFPPELSWQPFLNQSTINIRFISGFSIPFPWSNCQSLCHDNIILITIALL